MVWPLVYAVVAAGSAIYSSSSSRSQNKKQLTWNRYNATVAHNNEQSNIASQTMLGMFNAMMLKKAADTKAGISKQNANYNASLIRAKTDYNDALLEEEENLLWESVGLDLKLLERQRAVERGGIVADQGASGTTIGIGSNQDTVVDQMTQEMLDAFVIQHNADQKAASIRNARARNEWEGDMQVKQTLYDGEMGAFVATDNARNQSMGMLADTFITGNANKVSSNTSLNTNLSSSKLAYDQNNSRISQQFAQGLFSAASKGFQGYYGTKDVSNDSLLADDDLNTNSMMSSRTSSNPSYMVA